MIRAHILPETAFTALAAGGGGPDVVRQLREAERSKHTMLLHAVAEAAGNAAPASRASVAFRTGYELLARIQARDPCASAWLLGLPHLGTQRVLAVERIPRHQTALQGDLPQPVRGQAQFRLRLLLGQLVLLRTRGHRRPGFGPHPPVAPARGRS